MDKVVDEDDMSSAVGIVLPNVSTVRHSGPESANETEGIVLSLSEK
jgi:hypothetical protein